MSLKKLDQITVEILLLILLAVVCASFSSNVAHSKGHVAAPWFLCGLLFGPLALIAAVGLPDLKLRRYLRLLAEHQGAVGKENPDDAPSDGEGLRLW